MDITTERSSFLQNIPTNLLESRNIFLVALFFLGYNIISKIFPFKGAMHFLLILLTFKIFCSMITPNGRFGTQKKICLSMSDCKLFTILFVESKLSYLQQLIFFLLFHNVVHPESWNPMWSASRYNKY